MLHDCSHGWPQIEQNKSATKLKHDYSSKLQQKVPKIKGKNNERVVNRKARKISYLNFNVFFKYILI
jgi:hypothetical protein